MPYYDSAGANIMKKYEVLIETNLTFGRTDDQNILNCLSLIPNHP